jgi:hypothetical protein
VAVSGVGAGFEFHVTTGDAPRALRIVVGARNARAGLRVVNSEGDVVATDDQDADTPTLIYTLSVPAGETYDVSWTQASPTGDLALFGAELDNQADTTGISAGKYVIRPKSVTSGSLEPQDDTVLVDDHESSWTVTPVSGHLFTIRSVEHPSEFLAYSPGRGNGLALRDAASGSSQLWQIEINLDSSFKITPASNPAEALTCADGPGGRAISFAKTTDKTESQEWAMIEAKSAAR